VFVECCVGSGFCDEMITASVESKRGVCLIVCSLETSTIRLPKPELSCCSPEKKIANKFQVLQRTLCVLYANFGISATI